jgi:alpha-glucosidase
VWPSEPDAFSKVTLTLRTYACDAQAASLVYQLTADQPLQIVPLHWVGRDRIGNYDLWQAMIHTGPAGSQLTYRFDVHNGTTEIWLGATGVASTGVGAFAIAPGFHTPKWAQNAIFYQIFPDRFRNGS